MSWDPSQPNDIPIVKSDSSGSSACSGADARRADEVSVGRELVDRLKRFVDSLEDSTTGATVSPRSSDGPAWLTEYETWLKSMFNACLKSESGFIPAFTRGMAAAYACSENKLNELRSLAKANNKDESLDG
jgi:hypothetical protein